MDEWLNQEFMFPNSLRCCFAAPTAPGFARSAVKKGGMHLPPAEQTDAPIDTRLAILKSLLNR